MGLKRLENLSSERQARLFEAAAREFAAHGFDGASLNRILADAGMSKSSLYYYFEDKADLFTTMMERSLRALFARTGGLDLGALTAESYWPAFEGLLRRLVEEMNGDDWYVTLGRIFYRLRGAPGAGDPIARSVAALREALRPFIERGQALGLVREDLPADVLIDSAMGVSEAIDAWVVAHWDEMTPQGRVAWTGTLVDMLRRLLAP